MVKKHSSILQFESRSLIDWEKEWDPIPGGFVKPHPELRAVVGIMRARLNGTVMYIMRATEHNKGGIEKGLQRIRGPVQTGNSGYGARMIKENINIIDLDILVLGNSAKDAERAIKLKPLMIKFHQPEWNKPYEQRIKLLQAGTLQKS